MKVNIELSADQLRTINNLLNTREGKTVEDLVKQAFEHGLYNLNYRTKRNKEQWSQFKEWKASQRS